MELRQLRQFVAVADTLNFRRAALLLHMAQPPLSVAIRKLEEEAGAPLFDRLPRGVRLTAAGDAALKSARQCLAHAEELGLAARSAAGGERGLLRVGFVGSATYSLMPRLLPLFRARYPQVELVLRESTNLEMLTLIEAGQLDVGLVRYPTASPSRLTFEVVERDVFCAVMPVGHPLAARKKVSLRALAKEPLIDYASTKVPGLHAMVMIAFQQAGCTPQVAQEATQVQTVVSLVESGLGVALVPSVTMRLASKNVVFRPIDGLPESAAISLAMAFHSENDNAVVPRFRELAAALIKGPRIRQAGV